MMRFSRRLSVALAGAVLLNPAVPAGAKSALHSAVPCAKTTVAGRRLPTGPAQYESGLLTLANGASLRLQGTPGELNAARSMAVGDPVAACYGPLKTYADAGPSRTITVLDLANGAYYATLVGNWKLR
jgi:hypothetical protein